MHFTEQLTNTSHLSHLGGMQVLDAVAGALIGAFTWLNLGFIAPAFCWVYRKQAAVSHAS